MKEINNKDLAPFLHTQHQKNLDRNSIDLGNIKIRGMPSLGESGTVSANAVRTAVRNATYNFIALWSCKAWITEAFRMQAATMATAASQVFAHINTAVGPLNTRLTQTLPVFTYTISGTGLGASTGSCFCTTFTEAKSG